MEETEAYKDSETSCGFGIFRVRSIYRFVRCTLATFLVRRTLKAHFQAKKKKVKNKIFIYEIWVAEEKVRTSVRI